MGTPSISEGSAVADALTRVFGKSFKELDAVDFWGKDGNIYLGDVGGQGLMGTKLDGGRISKPFGYHSGVCENVYVIDDGDGRLGGEDLFLHADGYYQEKVTRSSGFLGLGSTTSLEFAFRFTTLFNAFFQKVSGYEAAKSSNLPANVEGIVQSLMQYKGEPFTKAESVLNGSCFEAER